MKVCTTTNRIPIWTIEKPCSKYYIAAFLVFTSYKFCRKTIIQHITQDSHLSSSIEQCIYEKQLPRNTKPICNKLKEQIGMHFMIKIQIWWPVFCNMLDITNSNKGLYLLSIEKNGNAAHHYKSRETKMKNQKLQSHPFI